MSMWPCSITKCGQSAVRGSGDCVICDNHLCSVHLQRTFHQCPTSQEDWDSYYAKTCEVEEIEITQLIQKINSGELCAKATSLRKNIPCKVQSTEYNKGIVMGGMNLHLIVQFEDGVEWIARIRRFNATSPPPALRDHIMKSEVATLHFLAKTNVPAPKIKGFDLEGEDNPVGVGYILMEKMPGKPLNWDSANPEDQRKVASQLADIYMELHRFPFDRIGCLDQPGEVHVGAFARECLTDFTESQMQPIGPYMNLESFYNASITLTLDLIRRREIYAEKAVDAYLIFRFLLDKVPEMFHSEETEVCYLTHADDKGDHILVDEDSNITGMIDWEWAYITSEAVAFNSPMLLLPVGDFFNGATCIGSDEELFAEILDQKGASRLAARVRKGRLHHQFAFCCTYDLGFPWEDLLGLFKGLRNTLKIDHHFEWDEWRAVTLGRYKDDDGLKEILEARSM